MNASVEQRAPAAAPRRARARFELLFAGSWLACGLFALPGAIYAVGQSLLGPYGENRGLGAFYADFVRDLAEPAGRAWAIALGPLILAYLLRLVFIGAREGRSAVDDASHHDPDFSAASLSHEGRRVEPRISAE